MNRQFVFLSGYYCWFYQEMKYKKQNLLKINGVTAMYTPLNGSECYVLPQKQELEEQKPQKRYCYRVNRIQCDE
jgi:hypothetical protein